ncbi:NAD(P)H-binding protein [Winogradskyella ursingii]|uniref:NAD(P)H-binding protein n=1 Tax=Winogradskyella ursingii TaxID=2686079 RepID=UPI0015CCD90B|nr:NAD(P)H-binding protein [Winogradskyella ursingii]
MNKNISIIGCGWLGLPLCKHLMELDYIIKGSTTSKHKINELDKQGLDVQYIKLNAHQIEGDIGTFLKDCDTLIINVPPGLRSNPEKNHVAEISHLIKAIEISDIKKVLYVGSISVFKDKDDMPVINSNIIPNNTANTAKQLIAIEKKLLQNKNFKTTILRFGGLFGDNRHPAKHLSGKKDISNPEAPINLIHQQDCIAIIASIINSNLWNVTLNACYPDHPVKMYYYKNYCIQHNLPIPTFDHSEKSEGKIIDSSELVRLLKYSFKQAP